jgi:hypothetical protein
MAKRKAAPPSRIYVDGGNAMGLYGLMDQPPKGCPQYIHVDLYNKLQNALVELMEVAGGMPDDVFLHDNEDCEVGEPVSEDEAWDILANRISDAHKALSENNKELFDAEPPKAKITKKEKKT